MLGTPTPPGAPAVRDLVTRTFGTVSQGEVAKNEVATVTLTLKKPIAFDAFTDVVETGRFVLVDGFDVAGGGIVLPPGEASYSI